MHVTSFAFDDDCSIMHLLFNHGADVNALTVVVTLLLKWQWHNGVKLRW